MLEVTKPILSVSHRCENGIESHLARHLLLKSGERHGPLIRKSGVNFVRAQIAHEVKSCVRAGESQNSCVQVGRLLNSQKCGSSPCDDAIVQPVVEDPADDDINSCRSKITTPRGPSEFENMKHELTYPIPTMVLIMRAKQKHKLNHTNGSSRIIEDS